ncbi:hypothetical protein IMZ48_21475 [Candidatus Bathyarchaeota archaeon]|nr:hypothetical protein [Candidatus Bathyarchaeota archaeon]
MKTLRGHLAGGDEDLNKGRRIQVLINGVQADDLLPEQDLKKASGAAIENHFATIVKLRVGEALMFAPSAAVGMDSKEGTAGAPSGAGVAPTVKRLGHEALKIRVRQRITADGGQSVMAV